ncbi:MAG: sigma-70 family RNA polymerase sigma factor [Myxococcales bacterium FL481]|nr:MAG: sigma-70 family RNA polymerase sigma factor [Myxococcales bacterium FL481]
MILRAQRGERVAQRHLVRSHERRVFALLSRVLRRRSSRETVEDLAQETFLRVFRALGRFDCDGPAQFSTWVLRIASNLAIDELRRRQLQVTPLNEEVSNPAGSLSADTHAERRALATAVERAVADLSPPLRVAFVLRVYHDLEYAQIAETLDLDVGTVKSRLSRARAKLKQALAELRDGE